MRRRDNISTLVGVLAKVLPTFANTTNTKIGRVLVVVLAVLAAANTANTANTRANTANTREPVVLALGAEHRARAVAARRRTAMRLAMRPAPAAADAARASRCRPTRHPATAPWPAVACRARQKWHHCASRAGGRAPRNRCTRMRPARGRAREPVSARLQRIERLCAHGSGAAAAQARAAGERTLHKQGYRTLPHHTGHGSRARQATIRAKPAHLTSGQLRSRRDMPVMKVGLAWRSDAQTLKGKESVLRAAERGARAGRVCSMGGQ